MSFRYKLFSILGLSQFLLVSVLVFSFIVLIEKVKNEPQDLRATEQAVQNGFQDRNVLQSKLVFFEDLMKKNGISIFELLDSNGKVHFRFHRPKDFGDDKSNQKIVQQALNGEVATILESGHSGLGFRMTAPFKDKVILIGQKVDAEFLSDISSSDGTDLAIFEKGNIVSSSNKLIEEYAKKFPNYHVIPEKKRIKLDSKFFYTVKLPYVKKGLTELDLEFLILIDETSLNASTNKVWMYFSMFVIIIFSVIFTASFLFSKDIIKAVRSLNFAMANIEKDEKLILNLRRTDEIGQMSNAFVQMKDDLMSYQHNLEDKIDLKTKELQFSLDEVNKLRLQQDGDYFLTSLLIDPLMKKNMTHNLVQVESTVNQKKKFDFKGKEIEIGGDLCITDKIFLRGIEYTVFMNADAMGKSLQGAGGALVMGTVFKAILQNTMDVIEIGDKHPEVWLRDCHEEIQKVFISFNGSMLISCIIGLVSSKVGTLYYFNAEHPFLILYRDKVASFIDNEISIRKIGIDDNSLQFKIHTFQLLSGDSIFIGSDGKDEILLKELESEEMSINTDDTMILRFIQDNDGNLDKIKEDIFEKGKIIDDFTLMKISFDSKLTIAPKFISSKVNSTYAEAVNHYKLGNLEKLYFDFPAEVGIKKQLSKIYMKSKNYLSAIKISEEYLYHVPLDTTTLLYTSFAYKELGSYEKVMEIGERILIREPDNKKNLIQLSEIYKLNTNLSFKRDKMKNQVELSLV
jgi:hypothetical protein